MCGKSLQISENTLFIIQVTCLYLYFSKFYSKIRRCSMLCQWNNFPFVQLTKIKEPRCHRVTFHNEKKTYRVLRYNRYRYAKCNTAQPTSLRKINVIKCMIMSFHNCAYIAIQVKLCFFFFFYQNQTPSKYR